MLFWFNGVFLGSLFKDAFFFMLRVRLVYQLHGYICLKGFNKKTVPQIVDLPMPKKNHIQQIQIIISYVYTQATIYQPTVNGTSMGCKLWRFKMPSNTWGQLSSKGGTDKIMVGQLVWIMELDKMVLPIWNLSFCHCQSWLILSNTN